MKEFSKIFFYTLSLITLLVGLVACANIVKPSGGPRDNRGPLLDSINPVEPASQSVNVTRNTITFHFDEFLATGSYGDIIFISPVQKKAPQILVKGKDLQIRLQDTLRSNTTYIVNIGKEIKDATEGNPMKGNIIYAFSTGSKLDSLSINGSVINPWTGVGETDITLMLYPANELVDDSIFNQSPIFACQTDSAGGFLFNFLPPGKYKLYGVLDGDKSFSWNQSKEKIALLPSPFVDLEDISQRDSQYVLLSFLPDNSPPRVKSIKWINNTSMVAEFREPINSAVIKSGIHTQVSDTSGQGKKDITKGSFRYGEKTLWFFEPGISSKEWSKISFTDLIDTIGNKADTALFVKPFEEIKKKKSLFREPVYVLSERKIYLNTDFPLHDSLGDDFVSLEDTSGNQIQTATSVEPFHLVITVKEKPKPGKPYQIVIKKGFKLSDSLTTDTLYKALLSFPDQDNFGNFSGEIIVDSSDRDHKWLLLLIFNKKSTEIVRRTSGELKFNFQFLEPGSYSIVLIRDDDGNGVWTPGSIFPYKMPEKIVIDPTALEIRAKWDLENYKVYTNHSKESGSPNKLK